MTYEYCDPAQRGAPPAFDKDMLDLREKTAMTVKGWAVVLGLTLLLVSSAGNLSTPSIRAAKLRT